MSHMSPWIFEVEDRTICWTSYLIFPEVYPERTNSREMLLESVQKLRDVDHFNQQIAQTPDVLYRYEVVERLDASALRRAVSLMSLLPDNGLYPEQRQNVLRYVQGRQ